MTTAALARIVGVSFEAMAELLAESHAADVVRPTPRGWRLTESAERRYGNALRSLTLVQDAGNTSHRLPHETDLVAEQAA